jgi:hypothetical protein
MPSLLPVCNTLPLPQHSALPLLSTSSLLVAQIYARHYNALEADTLSHSAPKKEEGITLNNESEGANVWASSLKAVLTILIVGLILAAGLHQLTPPAALPANAPESEFSSGRAMQHLRQFAVQPHPTGTAENRRVRDYLTTQLSQMGLAPQIQEASVVRGDGSIRFAATVRNVIARMPGTDNTRAVMLAAHYDSVPTGPGASDDGAAVAAILETVRALKTEPALRNDLIILITDGEELDLLGAKAFVDEHPWAPDVGVALNFEARGNSGPSLMFETSDANAWITKEFAKGAPHPSASSLMYALYKQLPNDTDMTEFKRLSLSGLNFAYARGLNHYHTMLDDVAHIDERSLQHHGSNMLALTRHFGETDLRGNSKTGTATYFNVSRNKILRYSERWVVPIAILAGLEFIGMVAFGFRRKRLTAAGIALGLGWVLAGAVLAGGAATALVSALFKLYPEYKLAPFRDLYNGIWYLLALVAITIAIVSALYLLMRRWTSAENLAVGGMSAWPLLMGITTIWLPAASFLFTWPVLVSSLGIGYLFEVESHKKSQQARAPVLCLFAAPAILLVGPVIYALYDMLSLVIPVVLVVLLVLLLGLLAPQFEITSQPKRWALPVAAALAFALFLAVGSATGKFDADHRMVDSIFYALDFDSDAGPGKALWLSLDGQPDEWTSQFFPGGARNADLSTYIPWLTRSGIEANATPVHLIPPEAVLSEDGLNGQNRRIRVKIKSTRQAAALIVWADQESEVIAAEVNGKMISAGKSGQKWSLIYGAPPADGIDLMIEISGSHPVKLKVEDVSYELPEIPGAPIRKRPDLIMPAPSLGASDTTFVSKSFVF